MNAVPSSVAREVMDRDFIEKNQIVERYLTGKLPPRGVTDFERYCRENPDLVEELGLAQRVNSAVRLLEASGKPEPWQEKPKQIWEKPSFLAAVAAAAVFFVILSGVLWSKLGHSEAAVVKLTQALAAKPLDPATARRRINIVPSRSGKPAAAMFSIGGRTTEFVELRFDLSWAKTSSFRITVDRVGYSGVAEFYNLLRDSNGLVRIALNSSVLGPGDYTVAIEGVDWRGQASPVAWARFAVAPAL
jgi:hypothetical protein